MNLPLILQRSFGIRPTTDTSSIRTFRTEEFRAFCLAGKEHHITTSRIHEDFKEYLRQLKVPAYVTETVKKKKPSRFLRH